MMMLAFSSQVLIAVFDGQDHGVGACASDMDFSPVAKYACKLRMVQTCLASSDGDAPGANGMGSALLTMIGGEGVSCRLGCEAPLAMGRNQ